MAGADRKRRVSQQLWCRCVRIVELVGIDGRVTAQRVRQPVCGAGEDAVGDRRRVGERDVPAIMIGRIVRHYRATIGAEDVREHVRILGGPDPPAQPRVPQRREHRELVVVDAHQHRNPGRPTGGESRDRAVRQHRCPGDRARQCIGVADEVVPGRTVKGCRRQRTQTHCDGGGIAAARCGRVIDAVALPGCQVGLRLARRALDDCRPEQPCRTRRHQVIAHRHAARGFAGDGHLPRIAAERGDVVADPSQRGLLVGQPVVAHRAGRTERRVGQETERTQPVVDRDDNDVAPGGQPARVINVAAAVDEASPVNPHHHRALLVVLSAGRSPDIERQAVFAGRLPDPRIGSGVLHALRPGLGGVQHPRPSRRRPR